MNELRTFDEWRTLNRAVSKGQRAEYYRVSPDRTRGVAVYSVDQTEPIIVNYSNPDAGEWSDVITAVEWFERKKVREQSKRRIRVDARGDTVLVWCGTDKNAIEKLKASGYRYDPSSHRWAKAKIGTTPARTAAWFEQQGYDVEREYVPAPAVGAV